MTDEYQLDPEYEEHLAQRWLRMVDVMKKGGYWDKMMNGGPELDRVKHFLKVLEGTETDVRQTNDPMTQARPLYLPVFPGLTHVPWRDPADYEWVPMIEAQWEGLRDEGKRVKEFFRPSHYDNIHQGGRWMQGNISAFGSKLPDMAFRGHVPKLALELGDNLPGFACYQGHPFGHYLYSVLVPGLHLPPHTSSDNLKIRAHLALSIPENCQIRVGGEARGWEEGKVMVLEDSLLHEAWNDSDRERLVLILDFWHPDLTPVEVDALSAGLGKWEIRCHLAPTRGISKQDLFNLSRLFQMEEQGDPDRRGYWPNYSEINMVVEPPAAPES